MKSKETKAHVMSNNGDDSIGENAPHFSKVDKVYVTNSGGIGGGGGEADSVQWQNVLNKPQTYPPSDHNHDDRYNTKEDVQDIVNYTREQMQSEQGKVMTHADDEPAYLDSKVDNVTTVVEGNELKVKSIDGLMIGVASINSWLSGTEGNIQTQLDSINDSLVALSSGMRYMGKFETYADLQNVSNTENGDLAVVLADENRSGGRSMYVYSDNFGMWEFIGEFTFTDEFLALQDTPDSYAGADGKVVKVAGERLVFDDVDYGDLANKPTSTITQIDDAVAKRHEHANKDVIDGVGESSNGTLTYKGIEYVRKDELSGVEKDYLFLGKEGNKSISAGDPLSFDLFYAGNMDYTDTTFTLQANKVYRVVASVLFTNLNNGLGMRLRDVTNGIYAAEYPDAKWFYAPRGDGASNGNGVFDFIIKPTATKQFQIVVTSVSGGDSVTQYNRNSTLSIHEI